MLENNLIRCLTLNTHIKMHCSTWYTREYSKWPYTGEALFGQKLLHWLPTLLENGSVQICFAQQDRSNKWLHLDRLALLIMWTILQKWHIVWNLTKQWFIRMYTCYYSNIYLMKFSEINLGNQLKNKSYYKLSNS